MTPEKALDISLLLEFYGALLTERQRELVEFYYTDDLSLSEIAENLGITRQGVRDGLRKAEEALSSFEEKLKLSYLFREREKTVVLVKKKLAERNIDDPELIEDLDKLVSLG